MPYARDGGSEVRAGDRHARTRAGVEAYPYRVADQLAERADPVRGEWETLHRSSRITTRLLVSRTGTKPARSNSSTWPM